MKKKLYHNLPELIKSVLLVSQGWLVGGAVRDTLAGVKPKDFDIIVPDRELYHATVKMLTSFNTYDLKTNTFGGLKFVLLDPFKVLDVDSDTLSIDLWPEEVGHFVETTSIVGGMYNLRKSKYITFE